MKQASLLGESRNDAVAWPTSTSHVPLFPGVYAPKGHRMRTSWLMELSWALSRMVLQPVADLGYPVAFVLDTAGCPNQLRIVAYEYDVAAEAVVEPIVCAVSVLTIEDMLRCCEPTTSDTPMTAIIENTLDLLYRDLPWGARRARWEQRVAVVLKDFVSPHPKNFF